MSFQQGLSGLNASAKALDVIGNNIANSSTVGFKSSAAHFADVYAASMSGGGASQVGIGVSLAAVQQQFSQGNITATSNPLDISINGGGFFRMENVNGSVAYTRNGQFLLDREGYIVNDQGLRLTGFPVDVNGTVVTASPIPLQISSAQIPPRASSDPLSGNIEAVVNLDSREANPALAPFNAGNPQTYNYSTSLSVYDTLGVSHTLTTYYVRTGPGAWTVHGSLDGANPQVIGNLTFNTSGALTSGPTYALPTFPLTTGAATPWSPGTLDFTGTTQYGSPSGVEELVQGGYTSGRLIGLSIASDGTVQGRYSNGQSRNQGQVVLTDFTNPNGLAPQGNNVWIETADSGPPLTGAPNTASLGVLQASSVEESNVDLTAELVNMITQQRNYQANAQTIKTQDQVLNTLVNLR